MMTFEIDQKQTFSSVDLLIGIEKTLLQKNILSGQATAKHVRCDEILFQDLHEDLCTHVKIYLKTISQVDLEMFHLEQLSLQDKSRQQLIVIYPDLAEGLAKPFKGHCRRVMQEHKCHALTAYQYLSLRSQSEQAIALKETVSLQNKVVTAPQSKPLPLAMPKMDKVGVVPPGNYDFYRQSALSSEELSEFLDLGVALRKKS